MTPANPDWFLPSNEDVPIYDSMFRPLNFFRGQTELCPNCLNCFETEFASIRLSQRCNVQCLLTLDKVPEENRAQLELVIHSRLLEQKMEANVFHAIQAYNAALACEQAKVEPLISAGVLRDSLARLNAHRDLLSMNSKYNSSEEERLRGGRIGVIQHLLSPEHQFGLPVWLKGILPIHCTIYPNSDTPNSDE